MKYKLLVLVAAVSLVAAACNNSTNNQAGSNSSNQSTQAQSGAAEVDMTANGFSPSSITVKQGTVVTFKNTDTQPHWPASNPHPTHTDLPGFDALQQVQPGQTYSFTFNKIGTWGYHDHINPSEFRGSVTVVQ